MLLRRCQRAHKHLTSGKRPGTVMHSDIAVLLGYRGQCVRHTVLPLLAARHNAKRQRGEVLLLILRQQRTALVHLRRSQHHNSALHQLRLLQHVQTVNNERRSPQQSEGLIDAQPQALACACSRDYNYQLLLH